jgi:glycosyltransferase involved in cell wall biosynthesis
MAKISICIPSRANENQYLTLRSLAKQTFQDFEIIICTDTDSKGANYARNEAVKLAKCKFILFSDNDINWHETALETLYRGIFNFDVCYGYFKHGEKICGRNRYDENLLMQKNFITMNSLVRRSSLLELDENLQRHQDWDLWIRMTQKKCRFNFIDKCLFTTPIRDGISYNGKISFTDSVNIIKQKHNLK